MYAFKRGFNQEQEKIGRKKRTVNLYKHQTEQKGAVSKQSYVQEVSGNVKEKNNIKQKSEEMEGVLM